MAQIGQGKFEVADLTTFSSISEAEAELLIDIDIDSVLPQSSSSDLEDSDIRPCQ